MIASLNDGGRLIGAILPDGTIDPKSVRRAPKSAMPAGVVPEEKKARFLAELKARKIEPVALGALHGVDERHYQRGKSNLIMSKVRSSPVGGALGVPTVARRRDGTLWIIDGQNRINVVREMFGDDFNLDVAIVPVASWAEEARLFRIMNKWRSNVTSVQEWKPALSEGDEETVAISDTLAHFGVYVAGTEELVRRPGAQLRHPFKAIGAVQRIYRQGKQRALHDVLSLVLDAWGEGPHWQAALSAVVLNGISTFLARYQDKDEAWSRAKVLRVLEAYAPSEIIAAGQKKRREGGSDVLGRRISIMFARALLEAYNQDKKGPTLRSWGG